METKRYAVSESLARVAKELNSHSDYIDGHATDGYTSILHQFDLAVNDLIEHHGMTAEQEESVTYLADRYSQKLAAAIDRQNRISAMCPSVLVSGAGNFPTAKKRKQNAADDRFWQECGELFDPTGNYYFRKIRTVLTNKTIYSNDEFVIEKLNDKLSDLEEKQTEMKAQNAYFRKHKTMVGYDGMTDEEAAKIDAKINDHSAFYNQPFPPYHLTSNNAEINRIKKRIEEIERLKQEAEKPVEDKYPKVDGVEVVENSYAMRIQLIFDSKPDDETRELLKQNGFHWSPKFGAWQRQLTANGIAATKSLLKKLQNDFN